MKQYYYFIERTDTHEWYYLNRTPVEGIYAHDFNIELFPSWTRDPLQAQRFELKEHVEAFMKYDTVFDKKIKCIITEHEFIINSKISTC